MPPARSDTVSPVPDTATETETRVRRRREANTMSSVARYQRDKKNKVSAAAAARYQASKCCRSVCHRLSPPSHFDTVDHLDSLWKWIRRMVKSPSAGMPKRQGYLGNRYIIHTHLLYHSPVDTVLHRPSRWMGQPGTRVSGSGQHSPEQRLSEMTRLMPVLATGEGGGGGSEGASSL